MTLEPRYLRLETAGPDGIRRAVEFKKSGFLTLGNQPELYFFGVAGEEVVVGISGDALRHFQRCRRYLSCEEKIDLAGLLLKRAIESGKELASEDLMIRDGKLARTAGALNLFL